MEAAQQLSCQVPRGGGCSHRLHVAGRAVYDPVEDALLLPAGRNLKDADLIEWVVTCHLEALPVNGAFRPGNGDNFFLRSCAQWPINVLRILNNSSLCLFNLPLWLFSVLGI